MADDIHSLPDATSLLAAMRAGRKTAEEVVAGHIRRLKRSQDSLNAAVRIFADRAMDEARDPRPGPLGGLPVSVKETFGMAGESVTAGSLRMSPVTSPADSEAVARLRAAGAIVVARSNVPEFAMAGETDNLRYGRTLNPLDTARTCGGSSGGEAALVASGGSAAGLGSDILGSIRIPASFCGLVGFKPASAAISKTGSWPQLPNCYTDSWLCAGPITRSVRDARLLYEVLAGRALIRPDPVSDVRIIIPDDFPLVFRSRAIPSAVDAAREALVASGARLERHSIGDVRRWYRDMVRFLGWELLPLFEEQLAGEGRGRLSITRETWLRWKGQSDLYDGLYRLLVVGAATRFRRATSAERAVRRFESARAAVRALLGDDGLILLPTLGTLAPRHGEMNRLSFRPGVNGVMTPLTLCNYLDLPAVSVPAWRYKDAATGLAPGVMLVARPGNESLLLDTAERLERDIGRNWEAEFPC
jgi:Asp-tRNA(Asn)/Glu-tRNA(Gln) amidotransferase A subunit family amidase